MIPHQRFLKLKMYEEYVRLLTNIVKELRKHRNVMGKEHQDAQVLINGLEQSILQIKSCQRDIQRFIDSGSQQRLTDCKSRITALDDQFVYKRQELKKANGIRVCYTKLQMRSLRSASRFLKPRSLNERSMTISSSEKCSESSNHWTLG